MTATIEVLPYDGARLSDLRSNIVLGTFNPVLGIWQASGPKNDVNAMLARLTVVPKENYNDVLIFRASFDDGLNKQRVSNITYIGTKVDDPLVIDQLVGLRSVLVGETLSLSFDSAFKDVDGDVKSRLISLKNGQAIPDWIVLSADGLTLEATPTKKNTGRLDFVVTFSDDKYSATQEFIVDVLPSLALTAIPTKIRYFENDLAILPEMTVVSNKTLNVTFSFLDSGLAILRPYVRGAKYNESLFKSSPTELLMGSSDQVNRLLSNLMIVPTPNSTQSSTLRITAEDGGLNFPVTQEILVQGVSRQQVVMVSQAVALAFGSEGSRLQETYAVTQNGSAFSSPWSFDSNTNLFQTVPKLPDLGHSAFLVNVTHTKTKESRLIELDLEVKAPLQIQATQFSFSGTENEPLQFVGLKVGTNQATVSVKIRLANPKAGELVLKSFKSFVRSTRSFSALAVENYNSVTGEWRVEGSLDDVNNALSSLQFVPEKYFNGLLLIEMSVSDAINPSVKQSLELTLAPVNNLPEVKNPIPNVEQPFDSKVQIFISNTFSDPDGDELSYSFSGPRWMRLEGDALRGDPGRGDIGLTTITVSARDQQGSVSISFTLKLTGQNWAEFAWQWAGTALSIASTLLGAWLARHKVINFLNRHEHTLKKPKEAFVGHKFAYELGSDLQGKARYAQPDIHRIDVYYLNIPYHRAWFKFDWIPFLAPSRLKWSNELRGLWFEDELGTLVGEPTDKDVRFLQVEVFDKDNYRLERFDLITYPAITKAMPRPDNPKQIWPGNSLFFKSQRIPKEALAKYSVTKPNLRVYKTDGVTMDSKTGKPVDWKKIPTPSWVTCHYHNGTFEGIPGPGDGGRYSLETYGDGKYPNDLFEFSVVESPLVERSENPVSPRIPYDQLPNLFSARQGGILKGERKETLREDVDDEAYLDENHSEYSLSH